MGAQTLCDEKSDKWVVNGKHDQETLANLLDSFIEKFLLCQTCKNPETSMEVVKNGNIELRCMACGQVSSIDMRNRLSTYIQKHPPSETKYNKAHAAAEKRNAQEDPGMGNLDGEQILNSEINDDFGQDDWAVDVSKEAVENRRLELIGNDHVTTNFDQNGVQLKIDPYQVLKQFLNQTPKPNDMEILKTVKSMTTTYHWKETNIVFIVFGALFDASIVTQIPTRSKILYLFIHSKFEQKQVLYLIERLCSLESSVATKISTILNLFYENDILEDEVLIKWYKNPHKKIDPKISTELRERAKKFIEWIETADSEEEE